MATEIYLQPELEELVVDSEKRDSLISLTDDCATPLIGKFYTKNHST